MSKESDELSLALIAGLEATTPIFDAADGMRSDLERRGWSPTAAEAVVLQWVQIMMVHTWGRSS